MSFLQHIHNTTPPVDKWLAVLGGFVSALTLSEVSTGVGIGVGLVTLCMITPRAILNWIELRDSNKAHKEARERAAKLLEEALDESSDY